MTRRPHAAVTALAAEPQALPSGYERTNHPPLVLHAEPWPLQRTHPCGTPVEHGVTRTPRVTNYNYPDGRWLPQQRENCPDCIARDEAVRARGMR